MALNKLIFEKEKEEKAYHIKKISSQNDCSKEEVKKLNNSRKVKGL